MHVENGYKWWFCGVVLSDDRRKGRKGRYREREKKQEKKKNKKETKERKKRKRKRERYSHLFHHVGARRANDELTSVVKWEGHHDVVTVTRGADSSHSLASFTTVDVALTRIIRVARSTSCPSSAEVTSLFMQTTTHREQRQDTLLGAFQPTPGRPHHQPAFRSRLADVAGGRLVNLPGELHNS